MTVSQHVYALLGNAVVYDELHDLLDADYEPTSLHRLLASLAPLLRERGSPQLLILTTNYHDLLEQAFAEQGEDELGVGFITLRMRSPKLIAALEQLPPGAWTKTRLERSGKHRQVSYHEETVTIQKRAFRQLAVSGLGRERATPLLTNQHQLTARRLIERYGQRWGIENQLAEQIRAFHLDSLCSQVPLAFDFDVALTVPLHRHRRRAALQPRPRRGPPHPARAHPRPPRRRLPQPPRRSPLVGRPHPQLRLPRLTPKRRSKECNENPG